MGKSQALCFIYALVTYILFCVVYTALNIPYSTMLSNVTDDESERLSFNMFKTIGSNGGGFVATGLTLGLVAAIGRGNQGLGFTGTVAIYAVLGVILLFVCFKNTKERIIPQAENMPVGKSIKVAIQNRPWVVACIIAFLCFTSLIMRNSGAMYYAKYYLENEAAATPLVSIATLLGIPLALVTPVIAKKVGAKRCVFIGALVQALSMAGIYFAGKNLPAIFILTAVGAVGFGIAMGLLFILGAETIDYSEDRNQAPRTYDSIYGIYGKNWYGCFRRTFLSHSFGRRLRRKCGSDRTVIKCYPYELHLGSCRDCTADCCMYFIFQS